MASLTPEDDIEFPNVLRSYVRANFAPSFDFVSYDTPSPRVAGGKPLRRSRVGLVTTGGARVRSQPPFDTVSPYRDASLRVVPSDMSIRDIRFNHAGYNTRFAYRDPDVVFPLGLLRRYVERGRVGSLRRAATQSWRTHATMNSSCGKQGQLSRLACTKTVSIWLFWSPPDAFASSRSGCCSGSWIRRRFRRFLSPSHRPSRGW